MVFLVALDNHGEKLGFADDLGAEKREALWQKCQMQFKAGLRRQQQQLPTEEDKQKQTASAIETTLQCKGSCKAE